MEKLVSLYNGQKVQRFQGQFRVTRTSRLFASLGGRIGPCSKLYWQLFFYPLVILPQTRFLIFSIHFVDFQPSNQTNMFLYITLSQEIEALRFRSRRIFDDKDFSLIFQFVRSAFHWGWTRSFGSKTDLHSSGCKPICFYVKYLEKNLFCLDFKWVSIQIEAFWNLQSHQNKPGDSRNSLSMKRKSSIRIKWKGLLKVLFLAFFCW